MNRQQQVSYGVGQGAPPGRFPPPRSASATASGSIPLSPGTALRSAYPFGAAGAVMSPTPGQPLAHVTTDASLDPSDFPALSSGSVATPSTAAANLFSTYASQAGQAAIGAGLNGLPAGLGGIGSQRELTADDFPALGGGAMGPGQDLASLAGAVNGLSLVGRSGQAPGQEQASALAALQAQQHRANLLGSMNGQRVVSAVGGADQKLPPPKQLQQSWSGSPPHLGATVGPGLLSNGTPATASSASSPLPPSATTSNSVPPTSDQQQSLAQQLRSPPGAPANVGSSAVTAHLGAAAPMAHNASLNPLATVSSLPPPTAGVTTGAVPQTPAQQVLFSPADRFGLLGLLHTIKTSDPDLSLLALGNDLTNLGLDLGATDNLCSSFITPWSDSKAAAILNIEPEFHLPSCYNVQPPPANTKIGNFSDETLFFIFYSQPRDAMQEMAAHELYKHNWRYHKELRLWLTKEAGTEPIQKTATFERGSYIFFDPVLWERVRKEFILHFESLETRRA
ncbi:hypothetical protein JCM11641_004644 [Rhodosporidiobolus odoratus]